MSLSLAGAITSSESLFTYFNGTTFENFSRPDLVPTNFLDGQAVGAYNTTLRTLCNDSLICLFEAEQTGNTAAAVRSRGLSLFFVNSRQILSESIVINVLSVFCFHSVVNFRCPKCMMQIHLHTDFQSSTNISYKRVFFLIKVWRWYRRQNITKTSSFPHHSHGLIITTTTMVLLPLLHWHPLPPPPQRHAHTTSATTTLSTHTHKHTHTCTCTSTCTTAWYRSRGLLFQGGEARQNDPTGNSTGRGAASWSRPVGEGNIHPPMGSLHHSEREGWDAAQSDSTVHPSRGLDYVIPTLCEVIPGN